MVLVFVLVLGAMIVIHEFGHFIVAKMFGIRVDVFSVGFGKRLAGFRKGDTDYRLSLIPLGGYVKMAGENLDEQITGAPDEFMSKPKWQRFCVAVAGPVMNILTALAIPAAMAMIHYEMPAYLSKPAVVNAVEPGAPAEQAGLQRGDLIVRIDDQENPTWRDVEDTVAVNPDQRLPLTVNRNGETKSLTLPVGSRLIEQEKIGYAGLEPDLGPNAKLVAHQITQGSPAEQAGLKPGDKIVGVNGAPVVQSFVGREEVIRTIRASEGRPVTLKVERDGQSLDIQATPQVIDDSPRLGFALDVQGAERIVTKLGPIAAIKHAVDTNIRIIKLTKTAIAQIFVGQRSARDTLTGPIGIARMTGQAAEQGAWSVFQLMAILSLNLGVFNLLPIPVLDGGLIFMLALESILGLFGLPLTLRIKEKMIQVGFVMLMLLMGFVIFNDISKWIPSQSAPQQQTEQQKTTPEKQPNGERP
jgi:regulator of sigma E protease